MAIKTVFEVFDLLDPTKDFKIEAKDLDGNTQTIITSANALRYISRKHGSRRYALLTGAYPATVEDATTSFNDDFKLWILNRQHNINKQYQALFDYDYSPIENVDRYETETTNQDHVTAYGKTETNSGTDTTTHSGTITEAHSGTITDAHTGTITNANSGKDSTVNTGNITRENEKAGFNSPNSYTNVNKETETYNSRKEELTHGLTETETRNNNDTRTLQNSDTTTHNNSDALQHGHTVTDGGTDRIDNDTTRTLRVHGNIGVTRSDELINFEIDTRKLCLAEMLMDNFMSDYTFYS